MVQRYEGTSNEEAGSIFGSVDYSEVSKAFVRLKDIRPVDREDGK